MRMIAAGDRPRCWVPSGKPLCMDTGLRLAACSWPNATKRGVRRRAARFPQLASVRSGAGRMVETYERLPMPGAAGNSTTNIRCVYLIV